MNLKSIGEVAKRIREKGKVGKLPYIEIGDVNILTKEYSFKDKPSILGCLLAHKGNILISRVRPTRGAISLVKEENICVSSAFTILEPIDESLTLSKFIFFSLAYNQNFFSYLGKMQKGTSYPSCRESDIMKFKIPFAPLPKQKRIVETFEKADGLRRKRREANELTGQLIQAIFGKMFGNLVINDKKWGIHRLGELGVWSSGGTPPRQNTSYFEGNIDWYTTGELNTRYLFSSKEKINRRAIEETSAKLFKKGSLLIGMYDTSAFKLGILMKDSASNQACANIYPNQETCNVDWLYSAFEMMKPVYLNFRRGIRQNNLNLEMIKKFDLPIPPAKLQVVFSNLVQKVEKIKERQQESKQELDNLFNSFMQRAFRG